MKRKIISMFVMVVMLCSVSMGAFASDGYEPNNSMETAVDISDLTGVYATIDTATDQDYYKINVTGSNKFIAVGLYNIPAGCDYQLVLLRSNGGMVDYSLNDGNADEYICADGLSAGTYYIWVLSHEGFTPLSNYHLMYQSNGV